MKNHGDLPKEKSEWWDDIDPDEEEIRVAMIVQAEKAGYLKRWDAIDLLLDEGGSK